jgi:hypothetical protein
MQPAEFIWMGDPANLVHFLQLLGFGRRFSESRRDNGGSLIDSKSHVFGGTPR